MRAKENVGKNLLDKAPKSPDKTPDF